jgi:hypothetical protein
MASGVRLLLDTGTFQGLTASQQLAMGHEVSLRRAARGGRARWPAA